MSEIFMKIVLKKRSPSLLIDYRETGLISLCNKKEIPFESKNLDVGDVQISLGDQPLVIIERKTLNDLACSIRDGRHREQKARLMATKAPRRMYLIEHSRVYQFSEDTLESSMLNTVIRDNLGLYQTRSLEHTCEVIQKILNKCREHSDAILNGTEEVDYLKNIEIKKRDNKTPTRCYIQQLAMIPGVSLNYADCISKKYPNLVSLIDAFRQCDNRPLMLKDISVGTRNLGPVVSKRIHEYMFGEQN